MYISSLQLVMENCIMNTTSNAITMLNIPLIALFDIPYSNRISPWLTEFGPLADEADSVSSVSTSACHTGSDVESPKVSF